MALYPEAKGEKLMAHIAKFKANQVKGLLEHNARTDETRPHNHSNEDIDPERTKYNYELHSSKGTAYQRYQERMNEVHCMKRDDVTVFDSLIVTIPKDVKAGDERKFFESVYAFACKDYGKQNIINATVHMDETTPHIHIGFIPVIQGKLRNGTAVEKVRHSALITKNYLQTLHTTLSEYVENDLGYNVSILNGATANGAKTVNELKAERANERANVAELKATKAEERATVAEHRADEAEDRAKTAEVKAKNAEKRATEAETALVNLLDSVPPLVFEKKPPKPEEEPKPQTLIYGTKQEHRENQKAQKEWERKHREYEKKIIPAWEKECNAVDERNALKEKEWTDKYLTVDNISKAKSMIEKEKSEVEVTLSRAQRIEREAASERDSYQQRAHALEQREKALDKREVTIAVQARTMADTIMHNAGYKVKDDYIQTQIEVDNELLNEEIDNHER